MKKRRKISTEFEIRRSRDGHSKVRMYFLCQVDFSFYILKMVCCSSFLRAFSFLNSLAGLNVPTLHVAASGFPKDIVAISLRWCAVHRPGLIDAELVDAVKVSRSPKYEFYTRRQDEFLVACPGIVSFPYFRFSEKDERSDDDDNL